MDRKLRAEGRGNKEFLLKAYRVSVWEDDALLKMDGSNGCIVMCIYLMPLNYTHKHG